MQLGLFTEKPQIAKSASFSQKPATLSSTLREHSVSIDAALQGIFRSDEEESRIQQARRIMGGAIDNLSDEELEVSLTELQHLLDEWLDTFEQDVFDGQTLRQVLGS